MLDDQDVSFLVRYSKFFLYQDISRYGEFRPKNGVRTVKFEFGGHGKMGNGHAMCQ